jgi:Flp pilus assembly protein TadG
MMMRTYLRARLDPENERGATLVIVVLSIVAIFSMLVLTVDVGGLLLRRRSLVNGADSAALAAGQTCLDTADNRDPAAVANTYANTNASGLNATGNPIVANQNCFAGMTAADKGDAGWVTVQFQTSQQLFFAGVLGFGNNQSVAGGATAAFGPASTGFALPIVLESGQLQGACKVPDGVTVGDTCAFWYDNNNLGAADWGFMNLDQWGVSPTTNCSNAGSSSRSDWIANGYPTELFLNGTPAGSSPTYVCTDTGHSSRDWSDLSAEVGQIKTFPVNDCSGQLDSSGVPAPCPATPDKYDVVGFTKLLVKAVYKGDDPLAVGTSASGTCTWSSQNFTTGSLTQLTSSFGTGGGCPTSSPTTILNFQITSKKNPQPIPCLTLTPTATPSNCDFYFDPVLRTIRWVGPGVTGVDVQYDWSTVVTAGACPGHSSDPNAICMVTQWKGFTTSTGGICLNCPSFGADNILLCDRTLATCPGQ